MPCSSMSWMRGSGALYASSAFIGSPNSARRSFPSGLPTRKYSSMAPGRATTSKVGLGM